MDDIYKINQRHLGLGGRDKLNERNLVSKNKMEQLCSNEQDNNIETKKEWSKMTKAQKLKLMRQFSLEFTQLNEDLQLKTDDEKTKIQSICWTFLREAMDKKRIGTKDIIYDVEGGRIEEIKSLVYNDDLGKFALKRGKNGSSISGMPNFQLKK